MENLSTRLQEAEFILDAVLESETFDYDCVVKFIKIYKEKYKGEKE